MNDKKIKGLFSFDGPLYRDRNGKYCSTTLTDEMFSRFFSVVEEIYVVVRVFDETKTCTELNMKELHTDKLHIISTENLVSPRGLLLNKARFEKEISETLKKIDLVFARMPSIISDSICKVCMKTGKSYLVEVGGCAWDSYWNHGPAGKVVAPLVFYWQKKYIKHADFATYVTKYFLQKRYPNYNENTNCSNVYLQKSDCNILNSRLKRIADTNLKEPVFGQVAASIDVKYKGEHLFIKAMRDLKKRGIYARFEIVGPGSGEFILEQARLYGVVDQVSLLGSKKKEQVFEWLRGIDVYIQPSKQEGLPRSVIEAMSVGCPCLGSDIAGIPELLDADCLFDPDNNNQIVDVSVRMLNYSYMTEQAYKNFERAKEYNPEDIEKRREMIFEKYRDSVIGSV